MTQTFRQREILELARQSGRVVVEELAARFDVTVQTVRRDLTELCAAGRLWRVYGGAVLPTGVTNIAYEERRRLETQAKTRIAEACAAEIPNNASVFLDIGTTTEAVAQALLGHRDLMVVTNNIHVAAILVANPDCQVVVAGGVLRRSDGALVGDVTTDMMALFKVDFALVGASALDAEGDFLDYDYREVRVTQAVIRGARRAWLLADRTKFDRTAPVRVASLAEIDALVTDAAPPESVVRLCHEAATRLTVA